jgi:tRNA threonylcarbamoyladenosine biosynthesis protein TsaB
MKILAIDTSTLVAGAALMEDGRLVCETNLACGLTHSERIMPIVDGCMKLAGWSPADLDAVAAVSGPGSFTGIRIGVSTAKGIAEAIGKPVVALNTLEVLAASFGGFGGVIAPLLDARRAQVYCAAYDGDLHELLAPRAMKLEDFLKETLIKGAETALFAGDGAVANRDMLENAMGSRAQFAPAHLMLQRAGAAAWLAWRKIGEGKLLDAADLLPVYLRKSSAEQVREAREAGL